MALDKSEFAARLEDAFRCQDRRIGEFSEACGVSEDTIRRAMDARCSVFPNISALAAMCEELSISADWLLFGR